jgi:hypothetical protein
MIGKVLHRTWGYNCTINDFSLVVDETPKTVVLVKLRKQQKTQDGQDGTEWPIVPDLDKDPLPAAGRFRATKLHEPDGPICSYKDEYYYLWDEKPKLFCGD